jgi:hypothetical protein
MSSCQAHWQGSQKEKVGVGARPALNHNELDGRIDDGWIGKWMDGWVDR